MLLLVALAAAAPLTWDELVARARVEGVDPRRAALTLAEAEALLRVEGRRWEPSVSAGLSAEVSTGGLGASVAPGAAVGVDLSAAMPLWAGGALHAGRAEAEATARAAEAARAATDQALVLTLAEALVAVSEARAAVEVERGLVAAEEAVATRVQAQVSAGARTRADALQQQATLAAARAELVRAEQDLVSRTLDTVLLLRLDPGGSWEFAPPPAPPVLDGPPAVLVDRAWASRPDLAAARAAEEAARAGVRGAQAEGRPRVDGAAGIRTGAATGGGSVADQIGDTGDAWVGVSVDVPLLDRGQARAAVSLARLSLDRAVLDRADAEATVAVQVHTARLARDAARATLDAARTRRDAAEAAREVVQQRYDAGAALFVELAAARAAAIGAERALATAEADVARAGYALAWAVGAL